MNAQNVYFADCSVSYAIRCKLVKIAYLRNKSFAFRLSAMVATDNRPGKVWPKVTTPGQRELNQYAANRRAVGAW